MVGAGLGLSAGFGRTVVTDEARYLSLWVNFVIMLSPEGRAVGLFKVLTQHAQHLAPEIDEMHW
jgi:hypothetical protein